MREISNRCGHGILSPRTILKILSLFIFMLGLTAGTIRASGAGLTAQSGIQSIQYDESDNPATGPDEMDGDIYREYQVSEPEQPVEMTEPYTTEPLPEDPDYYRDGEFPAYSGQGGEISSDPGPLVDEPYPLVNEPEPLVDRPDPLVLQPAPLVEQPYPLVDRNPPLVEHPAPLVRQSAPLVRQPRPLVNQQAPLVRQPSPLVNQPAPLVRQSSPLVSRPAPLVR